MSLITFTKENFEDQALNADLTVMIDFWAPWCGPCRMVSPIIDEIAEEVSSYARVGKVNVDEEPELAQKYGVMSIPTVIVLKGGEIVNKAVGARSKQAFLDMLK